MKRNLIFKRYKNGLFLSKLVLQTVVHTPSQAGVGRERKGGRKAEAESAACVKEPLQSSQGTERGKTKQSNTINKTP